MIAMLGCRPQHPALDGHRSLLYRELNSTNSKSIKIKSLLPPPPTHTHTKGLSVLDLCALGIRLHTLLQIDSVTAFSVQMLCITFHNVCPIETEIVIAQPGRS
jgi:hypothetical protein